MENWTQREDSVLRAGYEGGQSVKYIAEALGRSPGAVRGRASALNLHKGEPATFPEDDSPGACRYCGQIQLINSECDCPEAKKERRTKEQIENANSRITSLFGQKAGDYGFRSVGEQKAIDFMKTCVELLARDGAYSVQIQIDSICRAKLSITATGKINIERTETTKYKLEE